MSKDKDSALDEARDVTFDQLWERALLTPELLSVQDLDTLIELFRTQRAAWLVKEERAAQRREARKVGETADDEAVAEMEEAA